MLTESRQQSKNDALQPVEWLPDGTLKIVDQTLLPLQLEFLHVSRLEDLAAAIRKLKVRGAPAIGIAAAYGLAMVAYCCEQPSVSSLLEELDVAAGVLRQTRPTAANLSWALDSVLAAARAEAPSGNCDRVRAAALNEAVRIEQENSAANLLIGEFGASLIPDGANILTHCNTGPLAAGGIGTGLGMIYSAHLQGKRPHVWVDETRPLLQGARLTTWELGEWGISHTLIADNMAASLMRAGRVDAVIVGADRIAANGDVANKIGTYGLAVLAHAHNVPFYVAAPLSTIDAAASDGSDIRIEERHPDEVVGFAGRRIAPYGVDAYNPSFDVTPSVLVGAIVTQAGVLRPPFGPAIKAALAAPASGAARDTNGKAHPAEKH